jgi:hypothetical protein
MRGVSYRMTSSRFSKSTLIAFSGALALLAILAATPRPAVAATWTLRQLPPTYRDENSTPEEPIPLSESLSGVSCPTETLCIAVGAGDTLAFSQAPTGGRASWHVVTPPYPVGPGVTCIEGEPHCPTPGGRLQAVSCASPSFCVAITYEGFVYVSTDPTGGAGAWSPTVINESGGNGATHLTAVSCPSPSLCVAVSGGSNNSNGGRVLTSTDPTSGQWQVARLGSSFDLRGVSCGTPSFCIAVAREGRLFASTDPTGGASAWREVGTPGGPGDLEGIDCIEISFCAAGNAGGNILTSAEPATGAAWSEANAGGSVQITGVSCPTPSRCVAVDNNGDVLTSIDPTGEAGSWHFENLVPFHHEFGQPTRNALFSASCASTSLCALVGSDGRIFTSTDPFSVSTDPGGHQGRKAPRRPRTILFPTDHFWYVTRTRHRYTRASFRFYSPTSVRGFECKRDRGHYRPCHSPLRYWVRHGRHVLRVRAIGPTGLRGPAAIKHFRVLPSHRRHRP